MTVAIIVLNWNGIADTLDCLRSLVKVTHPDCFVVVVDNGSVDDSVPRLREHAAADRLQLVDLDEGDAAVWAGRPPRAQEGFMLVRNAANHGFAKGNNVGVRLALRATDCHAVLLLNNDTVVDPGFIEPLESALAGMPSLGVVGPTLMYHDEPGAIQYTGSKTNWWTGKSVVLHRGEAPPPGPGLHVVESICGAAMLVRRSVHEAVGFLDEGFFFGDEDHEFCLRARRAGFLTAYVDEARIWHKVGRSRQRAFSGKHEGEFKRIAKPRFGRKIRLTAKYAPTPLHAASAALYIAGVEAPLWAARYVRRNGVRATLRMVGRRLRREP